MVKHGLANFTLIILERCTIEELTVREQYWLDLLKPAYNILTAAKSSVGYTHTADSRAKMSGARPHYQPTAEQNAALAERNRTLHRNIEIWCQYVKVMGSLLTTVISSS
jgi:group I intron endonuclease